ncbi:TonB-dependent receptor domain-containing protein [Novosphingobium terrae]|uniref:TonB-dependent receptor domain-containing protein n=1 Tax=Novosphingobium terrae TaxID=2726189 RepID=UPI0019817106|nr:TonB-dependent receptor [Novosphingobium terrae]
MLSRKQTLALSPALWALMASSLLPASAHAAGIAAQQGETTPVVAPETPAAAKPTDNEIIVTGSRVISNGNNSPTPTTIISANDLLKAQPGTVASALQNLPVFQGSLGQGTGTGGSTGGPNGAANAVNLRNLGLFRTLVLFDGQRVQPSANTGLVTIDMIPQMLLQRVDVVTGGVSAVYGSDAISGVVNFVTDKKFNGIKLKAQYGISQIGDDPTLDTGIAVGKKLFDGRGHFEASFEYFNDPGIFDTSQRANGNAWTIQGAGTAANPYKLYSGTRVASTTFGGLINSGPLAGQNFTQNGVLSPFQAGGATGTAGFQTGGDGGYYGNTSLKGSLRSKRVYSRFDYDVTDSTKFWLEGFGAFNTNSYANQSLGFSNVAISAQNAFLPAQYQYGTAATTFNMSQIPLNIGPHVSRFDTTSYWLNGGLSGDLGSGIKWQVGASHGYSQQKWTTLRNINYAKLSAALDAVKDPSTGQVVCNVTLTNPGLYPGCAPLNLFGPSAASAQALSYVTDTTTSWATTTLDELTGSLNAAPFSTWAGPVNMALSGEYRKTGFDANTQVPPTDFVNCTGLRFNCGSAANPTRLHQVTFANVPHVHQVVGEVALEGDVPLARDVHFLKSLDLNLAARYANYNTFGGAWTWKIGVDWHVSDDLRLRATRSRDFRAPNLNDLYAGQTISRSNVVDQLTGATLINQQYSTAGNPNLKPEVGNTLTLGLVYTPHWLPHFSFSADAYDIKISNAITAINGTSASVQQQCNASGGTSSLCSLIVRPAAVNGVTQNATFFYNLPVNASSLKTKGIDFEANYATTIANRPISLRAMATWQPVLRQVTPGLSDMDVSGAAYSSIGIGATPEWRVTGFLNFSPTDTFTATIIQRWRSSLKWNADPTLVYAIPKIPAFGWTNLNLSWKPKTTETEFYVNVTNLFNQTAPIFTSSQANPGVFGAYVSTDDYVGRYFTVGARMKF